MKHFSLLLLAASSLAWPVAALGATRPHYGGTLRITMREVPQALDPVSMVQAGASNVSRLVFDTLVVLDDHGQPQPSLATSWQTEPGDQRWRISLRTAVYFSDGTAMEAAAVAASLRAANPEWKVLAGGDTVIVQTSEPHPFLPAELALARNAIMHGGQQPSGTGPFSTAEWTPGRRLVLSANDRYWGGRPFLDSIEVNFGVNDRDQLSAADLGRTHVAEVAPENIRRARADGHTVVTSSSSELLALVFSAPVQSDEQIHLRNALGLCVDTSSINNVVLQGGGEPTGALLPNWLSGDAFLFSSQPDLDRARQERTFAKQTSPLLLSYDPVDAVAHTIAERILLNARDVGITLQLSPNGHSDVALTRFPLASLEVRTALTELAASLHLPAPKLNTNSVDELYAAQKGVLQSHRVIPLLHLRLGVAIRPEVHGFSILPDGGWQISNLWLTTEKP